jgi:hypothetical protein
MVKPRFLAILQEATDRTHLPLELEAIEWALYSPYKPTREFIQRTKLTGLTESAMGDMAQHLDGASLGDMVGAGVWAKDDETAKHVLLFAKRDWERMSLDQHKLVFKLLERIVMGKNRRPVLAASNGLVVA